MSRRMFTVPSFTPTSLADTVALTNGAHMTLAAGSATQQLFVTEIFIQGLGTSSTNVNNNVWARNSTLATAGTPTALAAPNSDGPMPGVSTGLSTTPVSCVAATTPPQRAAVTTSSRLALGINCLGGVARWKPADLSEAWWINGQTASTTESSLSGSNAGGTSAANQSATIMYEAL